jgi:hypothetical protein
MPVAPHKGEHGAQREAVAARDDAHSDPLCFRLGACQKFGHIG